MNYNFPSHINGDTFDGVEFTITVNGSSLNLTSGSVVMTVLVLGQPVLFSTVNSKMAVVGTPTSGVVEFSQQVVSFNAYGIFPYEITFYLGDGSIRTYISGTWEITRS